MVKIPDDIRKQIFNEDVRKKMSDKRKEYYANMTPEQRKARSERIKDAMTHRAYSLQKELAELQAEFAQYKAKHPE